MCSGLSVYAPKRESIVAALKQSDTAALLVLASARGYQQEGLSLKKKGVCVQVFEAEHRRCKACVCVCVVWEVHNFRCLVLRLAPESSVTMDVDIGCSLHITVSERACRNLCTNSLPEIQKHTPCGTPVHRRTAAACVSR